MARTERPGREGAAVGSIRLRTGRALGSPLRLTLSNVDEATADTAWAAVVAEFAAVDGALSNYREDSAVSALNRRSTTTPSGPVDGRLYAALAISDRAWRVTDGRFDPRVALALQRLGRDGPVALPTRSVDRHVKDRRWLCRDRRTRSVATSEPVDLGGIGKGLALRWAWRAVSRILDRGSGGLLECGGDLVGRGPGPDGDAWLIALEDPQGRRAGTADGPGEDGEAEDGAGMPLPLAVIALENGAICTSSTRLGRWLDADGRPVHHLIDPATGLPGGDGLLAVTVAWADPAWAEILTKDLFLAGAGIAALARRRGLAAWWVTAEGVLEMTPRGRQVTRWP